jgi:hypothetical protein
LLAKRLLRSAQTLCGVLPAQLAGSEAQAAVPAGLIHATLHAAALVAAGERTAQPELSAEALALAKGVIQSMFWSKIKAIAMVFFTAALVAGAGGLTFHVVASDGQLAAKGVQKVKVPAAPSLPAEKKLPSERAVAWESAARSQFEARWEEYVKQKTSEEFVALASVHWLQAQLSLGEKAVEKVAAYKAHLERVKFLEKIAKAFFDAKNRPPSHYYLALYHRLEAEIWLHEAQGANQTKDKKAAKDRHNAMLKATQNQWDARMRDPALHNDMVPFVCLCSAQWLEAQLKLAEKKSDALAAHKAHLERMQKVEAIAKAKCEAKDANTAALGSGYRQAVLHRIEAELAIHEADDANQDEETKVARERKQALRQAAQDHFAERWKNFENCQDIADFVASASVYLLKAQLRLSAKQSEKVAAYQAHLERMKAMEELCKALLDVGMVPATYYHLSVSYRTEAEFLLEKIQGKSRD